MPACRHNTRIIMPQLSTFVLYTIRYDGLPCMSIREDAEISIPEVDAVAFDVGCDLSLFQSSFAAAESVDIAAPPEVPW